MKFERDKRTLETCTISEERPCKKEVYKCSRKRRSGVGFIGFSPGGVSHTVRRVPQESRGGVRGTVMVGGGVGEGGDGEQRKYRESCCTLLK